MSLLILLFISFSLSANDNDTVVSTIPDSLLQPSKLTLDSTIPVDTLREQDAMLVAFDEDEMLLQLISKQGQDIRRRDSLKRDSLLQDLWAREAIVQAELQHIRDSIYELRADELARQAYRDSVAKWQNIQDSITEQITQDKNIAQITITRSLVKDTEEDLDEMRRNRRNIYSPWRMDGLVQLQVAQSYISPNWYQGGNELNLNVLSVLRGNVNYSKNGLIWENLGEWRSGIANTPGDTLRKFNINDDQFRIYSKIGYQIAKNLYVSGSADFKTSVWTTWKTNTTNRKTTFGTPIRFNLDLGLDYKPIPNLSIVVAPASYKMIYATRTDESITVTDYGIAAGENILNDIGSSLRVKWKWVPLREITLETELYMNYTYLKRTFEFDWSTTCNFVINRFLTTRLTLHPRYNNMELDSDGKAKMQFKEILSVGFSHTFR